MFPWDGQGKLSQFVKHAHKEHGARDGGAFADEGLAVGSLPPQSAFLHGSQVDGMVPLCSLMGIGVPGSVRIVYKFQLVLRWRTPCTFCAPFNGW